MANNSVSKDDVKWFVKEVVKVWDARNTAKFAPNSALNATKTDLAALEGEVANINTDNFVEKVQGKGLSSNDFTNEEKALLAQLAKSSTNGY